MLIDKSWLTIKNRKLVDYMNGIKAFTEHVSNFIDNSGKVRCLCKKCMNINFERIGVVWVHLLQNGFHKFYRTRIFHGETIQNPTNEKPKIEENVDEMIDVLNDFLELKNGVDDVDEGATGSAQYFDHSFIEIEMELYPRCSKFYSLNFLVKLMHLKVSNK